MKMTFKKSFLNKTQIKFFKFRNQLTSNTKNIKKHKERYLCEQTNKQKMWFDFT